MLKKFIHLTLANAVKIFEIWPREKQIRGSDADLVHWNSSK